MQSLYDINSVIKIDLETYTNYIIGQFIRPSLYENNDKITEIKDNIIKNNNILLEILMSKIDLENKSIENKKKKLEKLQNSDNYEIINTLTKIDDTNINLFQGDKQKMENFIEENVQIIQNLKDKFNKDDLSEFKKFIVTYQGTKDSLKKKYFAKIFFEILQIAKNDNELNELLNKL